MNEGDIFLAFDYGTRNIGVAVGQKITKSASTLPPLTAQDLTVPWNEIDKLIENWSPKALIVGMPSKADGSELKVTKLAKNFIEELKKHYKMPVYSTGEHLTTKAAREEIFQRGGYSALQSESVDSEAAKIILEDWMNT